MDEQPEDDSRGQREVWYTHKGHLFYAYHEKGQTVGTVTSE